MFSNKTTADFSKPNTQEISFQTIGLLLYSSKKVPL